jgi:hypothetical protein
MFSDHHSLLVYVTDLGDSAVMGALVVLAAGYLWIARCRRSAVVLAGALVAGATGVALLKIAFIGCGLQIGDLDIRSPSGHAVLAVAVLGTLAGLAAGQLTGWRRALPYIALLPLAAAIAVTRVLLRFHSVDEVAIGLVTGGAVAALAHIFLRRGVKPSFSLRGFALTAIAACALLNGLRLPAEDWVRLLASSVRDHVPACRATMLAGTDRLAAQGIHVNKSLL